MKIKMKLISDTIFGDGNSIPGGEDISVQHDVHGFPLYKGSSFKGVFREEMERLLSWKKKSADSESVSEESESVGKLFGNAGDGDELDIKLGFHDFKLSESVQTVILSEIGDVPELVLDSLTHMRTFTSINENGVADTGSLRLARCVNQGLVFYSEIECTEGDKDLVLEVLSLIKWVGSMRNRGFGRVKIEAVQ